jgi:hypothetical protein
MDRARPSVITAFVWAYWDLYHALRMAWRSALLAGVILLVGAIATLIAPALLTRDPTGQAVVRTVVLVGICYLLTPFFLAIHRYLLLGEPAIRYDLRSSSKRFQLFFGWLCAIVFVMSIPSILGALTTPRGAVYYIGQYPADLGASAIVTTARLIALLLVVRLLVLFPAVAVDAPGATWQNAISDTRRHIWFVFVATILPFVPVGLLGMAVAPLLRGSSGTLLGSVASNLWLGATLLVALTLSAAIASRLYQIVGDQLNTPLRDR